MSAKPPTKKKTEVAQKSLIAVLAQTNPQLANDMAVYTDPKNKANKNLQLESLIHQAIQQIAVVKEQLGTPNEKKACEDYLEIEKAMQKQIATLKLTGRFPTPPAPKQQADRVYHMQASQARTMSTRPTPQRSAQANNTTKTSNDNIPMASYASTNDKQQTAQAQIVAVNDTKGQDLPVAKVAQPAQQRPKMTAAQASEQQRRQASAPKVPTQQTAAQQARQQQLRQASAPKANVDPAKLKARREELTAPKAKVSKTQSGPKN